MSEIGCCHNLRKRGFMALAAMPALRGLSVSCLNVDDEGISMLPSFPVLEELMPMDARTCRCADSRRPGHR